MSKLAVTLWWMLLYPFSAAIGVLVGYLVYLLFLVIPPLVHAPNPGLFHLAGTLLGLLSAGGSFVRTAGRLAPREPAGAASAACGIAIAGAAFAVHDRSTAAVVAVVAPIALGALGAVLHTFEREHKDRRRAAEADQREAASPQKPA